MLKSTNGQNKNYEVDEDYEKNRSKLSGLEGHTKKYTTARK